MIRRLALLVVLSVAVLAAPGQPRADQKDARLSVLFERLKAAAAASAPALEQEIWSIWSAHGGDGEVDWRMRQGTVLLQAGELEPALREFEIVVHKAPDFAEGWNKRATVRYMLGDFTGSVADIRRTLSLEPRHFGALSGLGMIYDALEKPESAIRAFEAALSLNPHMPGVRHRVEELKRRKDGTPL